MAETASTPDCTCILCTRRSDAGTEADHIRTTPRSRPRRHVRRSLPSTDSIMEVLYSPSYLGTPSTFPDPPSYSPGDTQPPAAQTDRVEPTERTSVMSSTTATAKGIFFPSGRHDPLINAPSLTGIPSSGTLSGRALSAEPNAPIASLGIDVLEETGPPPAYSRFDDSRPRPPVASDVLGPYPPISLLSPSARGNLEGVVG
ncbi:hypothetical protein JVU11DRAFT_12631 [Chiua virens]|nr:hypothetical protein JVU11DRAFT_12631 [Chiua virens]